MKVKRRSEVEWIHLDKDGNIKDSGVDAREEIVEVEEETNGNDCR